MATFTLTISDILNESDGTPHISVVVDGEPPLNTVRSEDMTPAQNAGAAALIGMYEHLGKPGVLKSVNGRDATPEDVAALKHSGVVVTHVGEVDEDKPAEDNRTD